MKPARRIAERLGLGPVAEEIVKQAIDQPLHVLMGVASVHILAWLLVALDAPALPAAVIATACTVTWEALREWVQWPPGLWRDGPMRRWWDPPLDWLFEAAGIGLGTWLFLIAAA